MDVESVTFEPLGEVPAAISDRWKLRVIVRGTDLPVVRAIPLVLAVGEQRAQVLMPLYSDEGEIVGLQGLLPRVPELGEEVRVGYADGPLLATGFEFSQQDA